MTLWYITGNVLAQAVHASLFTADNSYYNKCLETTYRPTFLPISLSLNLDCKCWAIFYYIIEMKENSLYGIIKRD